MSIEPCRPAPASVPVTLANEAPAHAGEIEALLTRAFGPGRFVKASERVREFADFAPEMSFVALEAGRVIGTVRMWRVRAGDQPVAFLGPIAVEEADRRHGLGATLVQAACEAARAAGEPAVVLVGDMPYFGRMGFEIAPEVTLPGPVDPRRVLTCVFEGAAPTGRIQPR
jgi:predicted N-acetyltransferase YhbS